MCLSFFLIQNQNYMFLKSVKCRGDVTPNCGAKVRKNYQSMQEQNNKHYFLKLYDTMGKC